MKQIIIVCLFVCGFSTWVFANSTSSRKAEVSCHFKKTVGADGKVVKIVPNALREGSSPMSFEIDLDSREVKVDCIERMDCLLESNTSVFKLVSRANSDEFFGTKQSRFRGHIVTGRNLNPIYIEGYGDMKDIFVRVHEGVAVLTYNYSGGVTYTSLPTVCDTKLIQ